MPDERAHRLARPDYVIRDLRHSFPAPERVRLAEDLSHEIVLRNQLEQEFSKLKATHADKIGKHDSTICHLTRKLCEGWEVRDIRCKVLWNDPADGQKTIVRMDTGEVIATEEMTFDERQDVLPLEKTDGENSSLSIDRTN